jgi:hypothetical protein
MKKVGANNKNFERIKRQTKNSVLNPNIGSPQYFGKSWNFKIMKMKPRGYPNGYPNSRKIQENY